MYSYSLQYLRQLDDSTRHRSNNTSCTRFRKDLNFGICYAVPLYSLYRLDICRNLLLLVKVMILILKLICLTHVWLVFEKNYDKMKHVHYNLYWNPNTVIPIETNFSKQNQEHFLFSFQMDDFSAMQWFVLVSQRLVLLLEEEDSSPCVPLRRAEWCVPLNFLPTPSRQTMLVKREYQCPV